MPVEQASPIEEKVMLIIRGFVGPHAPLDHSKLVGQELGINGGDSVELLDELEECFTVDLDPLIQQSSFSLKPNWFQRLLGKKVGPTVADVRIGELIRYIEKATREKSMRGNRVS